jgi:hypothetical protein
MAALAHDLWLNSQCSFWPIPDPIGTPAKPHAQPPLATSFAARITA